MAVNKYYGSAVTNSYSGTNHTWKDWTWITDTVTDTSVTLKWEVHFCYTNRGSSAAGSGSVLTISGTRAHATLTVNNSTAASYNQGSSQYKLYGGESNAWKVITYTAPAIAKTHTTQTVTWKSQCKIDSGSTWKGTSYCPSSGTYSYTVPALASYAVTYNANGGTGTIANDTKWFGEDLTLSDGTGFSNSGYTLAGWNTAADGTGTHYDLGDTYSANAALDLYAEWQAASVQGQMKINGTWETGEFYIKVNGSWVQPTACYAKVNGTWEQTT